MHIREKFICFLFPRQQSKFETFLREKETKFYNNGPSPRMFIIFIVPWSAAAVLRLAVLRLRLRLRLRPEVKPQGFWKNAQNEEKLENILKYLSIYTN